MNQYLPKQIRVWGYSRVNNSFQAKNNCDSRIYEYLLPTYVLDIVDPDLYPFSTVAVESGIGDAVLNFEDRELQRPDKKVFDMMRSFRIDGPTLVKLKELFKQYEGTNTNFHNFTVGKHFKDRSSVRNIHSFTVGEPFIKNGLEWVSLKVHGQSFMLHQIRKMVGMVVMMIRTKTPNSLLKLCFGETRLNIPKAPALGLLLEQVYQLIANIYSL